MNQALSNAVFLLMALLLCLIAKTNAYAREPVEAAGDVLQFALPAAAAGLTLGYKDGKGALQFGASEALALAVTYGLKYTVKERRPNGLRHSFPSGHTSLSFSAAEFMRRRYGWAYGIPAYAAASFVAYSRVEAGRHHPQDVVVGAAIGILSSEIFTRPYNGCRVRAETDGQYYGIRLGLTW